MNFDPAANILYRDPLLLILNKPAGLPVHGGPRSLRGGSEATAAFAADDNLSKYLDALRFDRPDLPQLAHRLDRDTSGCLVLGRNTEALQRLGKLFAQNRVAKTYWAIVHGAPPQTTGRIDQPLLRYVRDGGFGFRMLPDPTGQDAVTDYTILGQQDGKSWLELRPQTGRTHQLRVHCAHLGCPILGDDKYGQPVPGLPLHLHAASISVPLYYPKPPVTATAPAPAHFAPWCERARRDEALNAPPGKPNDTQS
jgi:tRNA pseudouridine32 synthase/23S rRNA pseudouridine746 synthase/23S rRNA pseudouridine1911/1915/1917 synthase